MQRDVIMRMSPLLAIAPELYSARPLAPLNPRLQVKASRSHCQRHVPGLTGTICHACRSRRGTSCTKSKALLTMLGAHNNTLYRDMSRPSLCTHVFVKGQATVVKLFSMITRTTLFINQTHNPLPKSSTKLSFVLFASFSHSLCSFLAQMSCALMHIKNTLLPWLDRKQAPRPVAYSSTYSSVSFCKGTDSFPQ